MLLLRSHSLLRSRPPRRLRRVVELARIRLAGCGQAMLTGRVATAEQGLTTLVLVTHLLRWGFYGRTNTSGSARSSLNDASSFNAAGAHGDPGGVAPHHGTGVNALRDDDVLSAFQISQ